MSLATHILGLLFIGASFVYSRRTIWRSRAIPGGIRHADVETRRQAARQLAVTTLLGGIGCILVVIALSLDGHLPRWVAVLMTGWVLVGAPLQYFVVPRMIVERKE